MEEQSMDILERIRASYYQLTATERRVADFVLAQYTQVQFMSITQLADVVLRCGSNEGPFQFGSVPAKVAQLVLMDAVFQEYCRRNREDCEEKIQSIASALSAMHV